MDKLIEYGWISSTNLFNDIHGDRLRRCMFLIRLFEKYYLLVDKYFLDINNLYFIGNNKVYVIDINEDFNYSKDSIDSCLEDYKKIKFLCKYNLENIFKYELISDQLRRDKRLNVILNS
jgi:hypothetical protein